MTAIAVGIFCVPAVPPLVVHAFVWNVPRKGGAVTVIEVGVIEVGTTVRHVGEVEFAVHAPVPKLNTTCMFGSMKLAPLIVIGPPPSSTSLGEMLKTRGETPFTRYVKFGPTAAGHP